MLSFCSFSFVIFSKNDRLQNFGGLRGGFRWLVHKYSGRKEAIAGKLGDLGD